MLTARLEASTILSTNASHRVFLGITGLDLLGLLALLVPCRRVGPSGRADRLLLGLAIQDSARLIATGCQVKFL